MGHVVAIVPSLVDIYACCMPPATRDIPEIRIRCSYIDRRKLPLFGTFFNRDTLHYLQEGCSTFSINQSSNLVSFLADINPRCKYATIILVFSGFREKKWYFHYMFICLSTLCRAQPASLVMSSSECRIISFITS